MSSDSALRHAPAGAPLDGPHRRRAVVRGWSTSVVAAAGTLAAAGDIGDHVARRPPGAFDTAAQAWALAHRTAGATTLFEWITRVGAPPFACALAVLVAIWLWRAHERSVAAVVVAAPIVAVVLFNLAKLLVRRVRPDGGLLLRHVTFSFPSGHAAVSTAVFCTLGWVLARERRVPWALAVPLALLCPLLIGCSRIYLDVHWATDVIAGWCVGLAVAALSVGAYEHVRRARQPHDREAGGWSGASGSATL